ncbi:hypothetical protein ACNKHX_18810 [Shigella flexneri]
MRARYGSPAPAGTGSRAIMAMTASGARIATIQWKVRRVMPAKEEGVSLSGRAI